MAGVEDGRYEAAALAPGSSPVAMDTAPPHEAGADAGAPGCSAPHAKPADEPGSASAGAPGVRPHYGAFTIAVRPPGGAQRPDGAPMGPPSPAPRPALHPVSVLAAAPQAAPPQPHMQVQVTGAGAPGGYSGVRRARMPGTWQACRDM